jgi:hypothetical protein
MNRLLILCLAGVFAAGTATADPPAAPPDAAKPAAVPRRMRAEIPLRVQAHFQTSLGEKKTSSIPYSLTCLAMDEPGSPRGGSFVRIGTEIPIPVTTAGAGTETPTTSFQYRNVGTNIECGAETMPDGRYLLTLKYEQSSIYTSDGKMPTLLTPGLNVPAFKTWVTTLRTAFRDGQTIQTTAGTDPNTGETATLDVTLSVMK